MFPFFSSIADTKMTKWRQKNTLTIIYMEVIKWFDNELNWKLKSKSKAMSILVITLGYFYVTTISSCMVVSAASPTATASTPVKMGPINTQCSLSQFTCSNGKCVDLNRYCDNVNDCGDGSDEPRFCTSEYFIGFSIYFVLFNLWNAFSCHWLWIWFLIVFAPFLFASLEKKKIIELSTLA